VSTVPATAPRPAGRVGTAMSALRLLREPFWLRITVAVLALSVLFGFLGRWQLHRHEAKVARNAQIDATYAAAPVPIGEVLAGPDAALPAGRQWTPVRVTGSYQPDRQVLIRNRPLDGNYGYEVVVPLRTDAGVAVLVDRGWVPPGQDFVRPDAVPAPPAGHVDVVVRLRPGEPPLDQTPPPGQEMRIDLPRIGAIAGGSYYRGAYGVLAAERPAPSQAPVLLPRPDEDLGPHLSYAVQWWAGALAAWVLLGVYLVKDVGVRAGGGIAAARPARVRRRAPTDEEWEDAAQPPQ